MLKFRSFLKEGKILTNPNHFTRGHEDQKEVYHGTARRFNEFKPNTPKTVDHKHTDTHGIYFSPDKNTASGYAHRAKKEGRGEQPRIVAAKLHMENPLDITPNIKKHMKRGMSFGDAKREARKQLTDKHDGIIFHGNSYNQPEYTVFHPHQIDKVK